MGRPPKQNPRNCQLNIGLTRGELELVHWRAAATGMRPAEYGRAALVNAAPAKAAAVPPIPSSVNRLVFSQLRRLANNLNQLMRHLHMTREPAPPTLEPLLGEIRTLLDRLFTHDR